MLELLPEPAELPELFLLVELPEFEFCLVPFWLEEFEESESVELSVELSPGFLESVPYP